MNKLKVIKALITIEREACSPTQCKATGYDNCQHCYIHKAINEIMDQLDE